MAFITKNGNNITLGTGSERIIMAHKLHTLALIALITCASSTQAAEHNPQYEAGIQQLCGNIPPIKPIVQAANKGDELMVEFFVIAEKNGKRTIRKAERGLQQYAIKRALGQAFDKPA